MKYHIEVNNSRIASFSNECDRDICFDALKEYWGEELDQNFTKEGY